MPRSDFTPGVDYVVEDRGYATPCWIWQGSIIPNGYGDLWLNGKVVMAHRAIYERDIGPIPEGLQLDHRCRVRRCVNPSHLEPVTMRENILRGVHPVANVARTGCCKWGHAYTPANTMIGSGQRHCRECVNKAQRENRRHRKQQQSPS